MRADGMNADKEGRVLRSELKVLPYMAVDRTFHIRKSECAKIGGLRSVSTGGEWKSLGQNKQIPVYVWRLRMRRWKLR
jgi:hypothetical protein